MRIGVDVRSLSESKTSGVEEYTQNLLHALFRLDQENTYILFYNSFKKELPAAIKKLEAYPHVFLRRYRWPNKILNITMWYFRYPLLDKLLDVSRLYSPNLIFTAVSARCEHYLTVHDLSFVRHPEFFNRYRRLWHWLVNPRRLVRRAKKIIAVSDSTRNDLINLYRCPAAKIARIYPGKPPGLRPVDPIDPELTQVRRKYQLPDHYILTLSTLEPRKNIDSVILAYEHLRRQGKIKHKLVIAGAPGWLYERTQGLIARSRRRQDLILLGEVAPQDRRFIYAAASLFVYPSFYEGFGFPPLEALATGTTVVCSHLTSLPEVVGDSALLIDPYNREELAWAMERGLKDQKLKKLLQTNGFRQVRQFNWRRTAREFLEVLTSA